MVVVVRVGVGSILMKMGHIIKADLTRFIYSSGSRTVNTQIIWTVPLTAADALGKIRFQEATMIPLGKCVASKPTNKKFTHILSRQHDQRTFAD